MRLLGLCEEPGTQGTCDYFKAGDRPSPGDTSYARGMGPAMGSAVARSCSVLLGLDKSHRPERGVEGMDADRPYGAASALQPPKSPCATKSCPQPARHLRNGQLAGRTPHFPPGELPIT